MATDPMVGSIVRLLDAPEDPRNGAYFRVTEVWGNPPRYAAQHFIGFEPLAGEPAKIVRGGVWNVTIEEPGEPSATTAPMAFPPRLPEQPTPPAQSFHQKRHSVLADLLGVHTADVLLSRRKTWVGAVICATNVPQTDPYYATYWRVRESWRNPDGTFHIASDYLGTEMPRGEPVYIFDGTTWDLPAVPITVFPKWVPLGTAVMLGCGLLFLLAAGSQVFSDEAGYLGPVLAVVIGVVAFIVLVAFATGWSWFYRVEPVRGSKVLAGMAAVHYARQHHDSTTYSEMVQPPDWMKEQAAEREAKRDRDATAAEIKAAVAKALDDDRRRRGQA